MFRQVRVASFQSKTKRCSRRSALSAEKVRRLSMTHETRTAANHGGCSVVADDRFASAKLRRTQRSILPPVERSLPASAPARSTNGSRVNGNGTRVYDTFRKVLCAFCGGDARRRAVPVCAWFRRVSFLFKHVHTRTNVTHLLAVRSALFQTRLAAVTAL